MALVDKNEMMELGKFFINGIVYGGTNPINDYILKDKPSFTQKLETKATLLKCLNTVKKMKAKGADRNDMLDALTYAYILLETPWILEELRLTLEWMKFRGSILKKYS